MTNWKIEATSDLHGSLPHIDKEFDILFICGDVCPAHDHYVSYQTEWLRNEFIAWIKALPYNDNESQVIMIPGNHDFALERSKKSFYDELRKLSGDRLLILKNENVTITNNGRSLKVFGTPYCKQFYNWAFMIPDKGKMRAKYNVCDDDVDFLLTHDSPTLGGLGMITQGWSNGTDAGNEVLSEVIVEKKPHVVLSGHIHSGNHDWYEQDGMMMTNVSYVDEHYDHVNNVLFIDYNPETRVIDSSFLLSTMCEHSY